MDNNTFELFLKTCGTERFAASLLGITQPHISQIRNGYRELSYEKAILIADYLKEKINLDINPINLISDSKRNKFILSKSSLFSNIPITYGKIDLRKIVINKDIRFKKFKEKPPIIIDEFNHLISGEETYFYHLNENKKVIDGYKFHLQKLVNQDSGKAIRTYLAGEFDLITRTKLA
ncbi:helix-turn-helix domain-containing protein [Rickettsiella endosymbiont of Dermanyssus gallinae]|uniref:helix-turn-helix domain-containing protein n=1 Tax=Rickettsiella endosymbiont of Dermanyssus gallinae TaxID=2856608 RepID=UPI001C5314F4|nr:helix-turn-helix transcriptional regulator [Rickettsiella endosymbiont of Dermanyssus gallinae]